MPCIINVYPVFWLLGIILQVYICCLMKICTHCQNVLYFLARIIHNYMNYGIYIYFFGSSPSSRHVQYYRIWQRGRSINLAQIFCFLTIFFTSELEKLTLEFIFTNLPDTKRCVSLTLANIMKGRVQLVTKFLASGNTV